MIDEYQRRIEDAVIGACLVDGDCVETAIGLGIICDHFTQLDARETWNIMCSLNEQGISVDLVTVGSKTSESLRRPELLKYITKASSSTGSSQNIESHCWFLKINHLTEQRREIAKKIAVATTADEIDALSSSMKELEESFVMSKGGGSREINQIVNESKDEYIRRSKLRASGEMAGVTTGLQSLDRMTNGWQDSRLIIFAGRPGMGKTALSIHFALSAAVAGRSVRIYSLEMTGREIVDRMVCAVSNIDGRNFAAGYINEAEMEEFDRASRMLSSLPIYIDDTPMQSTAYIKADAKKWKKAGSCDLVIVDYLQLVDMRGATSRSMTRENQVSMASRDFKLMAKEIGCPVIVLCQLNRAVEGRSNKKPMLSDLRESGSIEQDADMVLFVYREEYYAETPQVESTFPQDGVGEIIVAKHRAGPLGNVQFNYNQSLTKIRDLSD